MVGFKNAVRRQETAGKMISLYTEFLAHGPDREVYRLREHWRKKLNGLKAYIGPLKRKKPGK